MRKIVLFTTLILSIVFTIPMAGQDLEAFEATEEWKSEIMEIAPSEARVTTETKKKILVFSLHTGFKHWVIPHTEAIVQILARKSQAFEVTVSYDISSFEKKNLKKYDAIVLNNTCSSFETRNIFWDALEKSSLTDVQRQKKADKLERNLLKHVKSGHGLVVLHGGIVMQNKSSNFGEMVGGNFEYHPKQQNIQVNLVDPKHPMVRAFNGKGFEHTDEPYFFKNAYFDYDFRPLLAMDANKIEGKRTEPKDNIKYISWIKKYGKGRVFYCSPSHNAQSYKNPQLLQFILDGMQYATGDFICDDSAIGKP